MYESIYPSQPLSYSQAAWRVISEYSGIATLTGTRERDREGWAHIETLRRLGYHREAEAARKELIYGWGKEASAELVMAGWGSVTTTALTPLKMGTTVVPKSTVQANRLAGQVGENFLRDTYGGVQQVFRQTSIGGRYIDNLVEGIAMESKVGKTSLTPRIQSQVLKDIELMNTPGSGITNVQWHFFPSKTGVGPTGPLREVLEKARIDVIIH